MARVLSPLTWYVSHLVGTDPGGELKLQLDAGSSDKPKFIPVGNETVVPLYGPPKSWIQPHGTTPGCIACKQRESKGTLHGRVHGKNCKQRYKEFLEQELRKRRERERVRRSSCFLLQKGLMGNGLFRAEWLKPGQIFRLPSGIPFSHLCLFETQGMHSRRQQPV